MLGNLLLAMVEGTAIKAARLISCSVGVIVVALVLGAAPAFGQADYSDIYFYGNGYSGDDASYDADLQQNVTVIGVGVTDNDYSADAIGVETLTYQSKWPKL